MSIPAVITEPGIYDMDADTYHADPCETVSMSAGMVGDLLTAPKKAWVNNRRLNPDWEEPEGAERFSIGTVSHIMFLEPHLFDRKVVVVEASDWRTNAAKGARDDAICAGKTPILAHQMAKVREARKQFLASEFLDAAFRDGVFEQSLFWKHPVHGFWCRARPDFLRNDRSYLNDYKATANANPEEFGRHAFNMRYHSRAAWYLEGCRVLFGEQRRRYWFCNQETKAPYLTSVCELDMTAIEAGQMENDRAASVFARCLETGDWHGYRHRDAQDRDRAFTIALPSYALIRSDERAAA